ncbi:hypothetical protein [Clostridium oceanicum]
MNNVARRQKNNINYRKSRKVYKAYKNKRLRNVNCNYKLSSKDYKKAFKNKIKKSEIKKYKKRRKVFNKEQRFLKRRILFYFIIVLLVCFLALSFVKKQNKVYNGKSNENISGISNIMNKSIVHKVFS